MTSLKRILALLSLIVVVSSGVVLAGSVTLNWTAPGDDGYGGTAAEYDLRYSTENINLYSWHDVARVEGMTPPLEAGQRESFTIDGLDDDLSYFFAIKTRDEAGNWSAMSNVAVRTVCLHGCLGIRGNVTSDSDELVNVSDLQYLINYLFAVPAGPKPICPLEANVDGDIPERIDVSDVDYLVDFLFGYPSGPEPPLCP